jgi:hypothetical protein
MSTATTGRRKTAQDYQDEINELAEQLNSAVAELTSSQVWLEMFRVSARFTKYSPSNVLLLWMQAQQRGVTLTRVAGYRTWQSLGRQVVKGARSFAVLAPVRRRLNEAEAAQRSTDGLPGYDSDGRPAVVLRGFKLERVLCATRRMVVSPAQPGGTRREVPGSDG